jgi:hypothetical protein
MPTHCTFSTEMLFFQTRNTLHEHDLKSTADVRFSFQGKCFRVSIRPFGCLDIVTDVSAHARGVRTGDRKQVGSAVAVWLCRNLPYRDRRPRQGKDSPRLTEFRAKFAPWFLV